MEARSVYKLQILLLILYFAAAAALWPTLPERVPIHFDFAGRATNWARTSVLSWFGLPLLAIAMTLFLYGMGRVSVRTPGLWNIPDKDRFLALPPAARAPIEAYLHRLFAWSAVLVTVTFIGIHVGMYETAVGRSVGQSWQSHLLTLAPTGVLLLLSLRITQQVGEQIRQASERQAGERNAATG